jgi:hypothetical protein
MKTVLLFFGFFFSVCTWSQDIIVSSTVDSLTITVDNYIGRDNLKNDYFLKNNVLKKINAIEKFQYQNLSLGNIEKVCLTNPLQIVLFYKDFNTVVLLDNQLNETQQIDGNKLEIPIKIEGFGLAGQNQVWLYDGFLQKISLYSFSTNTNKIISTPILGKIKDYFSDYNFFYWIDESNTLNSISIFGKIKTIAEIPNYDSIQVVDQSKLIYSTNQELFYFNTNKQSITKIDVNEKSFDNFFFNNGILSIFTHYHIINYKIDLP